MKSIKIERRSTRRSVAQTLRLGALLSSAFLAPAYAIESDPLPHQEISVDLAGENARSLEDDSHVIGHQEASSVQSSFLQRQQISGPVYWTWGANTALYSFGHVDNFSIHQLQSYAAEFSLEYVTENRIGAYIKMDPGVYFENHVNSGSWDIPVQAVTGIPITSSLAAVAGFSNGRFYHHVLPIGGLAWTINDRMSLNALYPEPAFIVKVNPKLTSSLGGELLGGGFQVDSLGPDARVQYWEYRVGETLSYKFQPSWKVSAGAGYEWRRVFDLYRNASSPETDGGMFIHLGLTYAR